MASSDSGGVKVVSIAHRVSSERERLIGMTNEERAWRAKYLKSQILSPDEPITPENYYKEYYNPLRRLYRAPLNVVEGMLTPLVGSTCAAVTRGIIGKSIIGIIGFYGIWYYFKYNTFTWMRQSAWVVPKMRKRQFAGAKDYKGLEKPKSFATYGFEKSPI